jgi:hypothetical protein
MTITEVKPTFARNLKWAALIFLYQWLAWGLFGGIPSTWPGVIMPVLNQLHERLYWLEPAVECSLLVVPMTAYFLLIYRSNICRRESMGVRILVSFVIAYPVSGFTSAIVYRTLNATGWFPFFDAGMHPLNA